MFGPHLDATSGISNVVNNWIKAGIRERIELDYVSTLRKYVPRRYVRKFLDAAIAYVLLGIKTRQRVDIIHIHLSHGMSFFRKLIIFKAAKKKGIKTVVHLHGSMFYEFFNNSSPKIQKLIRNVFDQADAVFVLSKSWKEFVNGISDNRNVYVLYNGASLDQFSQKSCYQDRVVISFMGRLGQRKGVYDLLDAFEQVIPDFPDVQLVLGGDGDVDKVRDIVARKKLEKRVHVPGWVSGEQKMRVFRECDIYVLPSYNEGLPGSILEAMAAGVPIISTPVGGIPEAVLENRNGFLIDPGDIEGLSNKLRVLCGDKELREKMGAESRNIIKEKFDIEKIVSYLIDLYQKVVAQ